MKDKRIDELCGKEAGSFKKFLKDKETYVNKLENKRIHRIKAGNSSKLAAWAA